MPVLEPVERREGLTAREKLSAHKELMDKQIEINSAGFDKSMAYVNVILIAGYAGAFTTWSLTREHLSETGNAAVAILLSSSLFVFCAWEVFKMLFFANRYNGIAKILNKKSNPEDILNNLNEFQMNHQKRVLRLVYPWYCVLALTVVTGFGAGTILMWNYLATIIGWPSWPT